MAAYSHLTSLGFQPDQCAACYAPAKRGGGGGGLHASQPHMWTELLWKMRWVDLSTLMPFTCLHDFIHASCNSGINGLQGHQEQQKGRQGTCFPLALLLSPYCLQAIVIAADKFDFSKGTRFPTLAAWYVRAACVQHLQERSFVHIPKQIQQTVRRVQATRRRYREENNGQTPSMKQLAELTNLSLAEVSPELQELQHAPPAMHARANTCSGLAWCKGGRWQTSLARTMSKMAGCRMVQAAFADACLACHLSMSSGLSGAVAIACHTHA